MPQSSRLILLACLLIGLAFSITCDLDHATPGLFADEAVYVGMTQSLLHDFDLVYSRDDLRRLFIHFPSGPIGIILRQSSSTDQVYFAKPFTYSVFVVPFYHLFGLNGFIVLNVLAWWICLYCISHAWHHELRGIIFGLATLLVSGFSPYAVWMHPEMFTAVLVAIGSLNWRRAVDTTDQQRSRLYICIMAAAFTLAGTIKPQLLLFAALGFLQFLRKRNFRASLGIVGSVIIIVLIFIIASVSLTGSSNAYSGNRKIFVSQFPFEDSTASFDQFGNSWSTENARMYVQPIIIAWNVFFFLFGRFTGILPYFFPAFAVLLLLFKPRYRSSIGSYMLPGVIIICIVQIVLIPTNYHGGGGALGNRYFILLVPAILISLSRAPSWRFTTVACVLSALFTGPFLLRVFSASFHPGDHAQAGILRCLPPEWTLIDSLPIFDPSHNRVVYDGIEAGFLFLDRNSFGKEMDGFWVRGDSRADFFVKSPRPLDRIGFRIGQPLADVEVTVRHRFQCDSFMCHPGELIDREIAVSGHPFMDIYGRRFWIYSFSIDVAGGGIPKYITDSSDSRYLGAFVRPRTLQSTP